VESSDNYVTVQELSKIFFERGHPSREVSKWKFSTASWCARRLRSNDTNFANSWTVAWL